MSDITNQVLSMLAHFRLPGSVKSVSQTKVGHINQTYFSECVDGEETYRFTHQRINTQVFKNPKQMMENIYRVTTHIQNKLRLEYEDISQRCLEVIPTIDGSLIYEDFEGGVWRTYRYIDRVKTIQTVTREEEAFLLGEAVGTFQTQLSDFSGSDLHVTIKDFHDMRVRYAQLEEAVRMDRVGRVSGVSKELEFLYSNKERGCIISDLLNADRLPLRVTHNDTKISNVLFSEAMNEGLCIIDLDTVMPGTILFDTGDMIRSATTSAAEDESDLSLVRFNTAFYDALLAGYRSRADFLTNEEQALLKESGRAITQIMAVRFFTDYLNGDIYYRIDRPTHNIDRARNQIALIKDMDRKWDEVD